MRVQTPSEDETPSDDETLDELLRGRVRLLQARKGYRTSVDAMALAWFAADSMKLTTPASCIDLGAGSGLVAMLLGLHFPDLHLLLCERQPDLAARAGRNLLLNGLSSRAEVRCMDLAGPGPDVPPVDLVVCNPPYFRDPGRQPPRHPERFAAHWETTAPLERFAEVAAALLAPTGTASFVYPADGEARLVAALGSAGLGQVEVARLLHREGDPEAVRVLVNARRGPHAAPFRLADRALHEADTLEHTYTAAIESFLLSLGSFDGRKRDGNAFSANLRHPYLDATLQERRDAERPTAERGPDNHPAAREGTPEPDGRPA